jgi:hypothetical protein
MIDVVVEGEQAQTLGLTILTHSGCAIRKKGTQGWYFA